MYDIFVSYSHADKALVKPVVQLLSVRGRKVFWDENITPGERWSQKIVEALQESATVMVLWCCHSAKSKWVGREAAEAESASKELVPVLLCGYPMRAPLGDYQVIDCRESIRHDCPQNHADDLTTESRMMDHEPLLKAGLGIESYNSKAVQQKWLELADTTVTGKAVRPKPRVALVMVGLFLFALVVLRPFESNLPLVVIHLINLFTVLAASLASYLGTGISGRRQIRQAQPESQRLGLVLEAVIQLQEEGKLNRVLGSESDVSSFN